MKQNDPDAYGEVRAKKRIQNAKRAGKFRRNDPIKYRKYLRIYHARRFAALSIVRAITEPDTIINKQNTKFKKERKWPYRYRPAITEEEKLKRAERARRYESKLNGAYKALKEMGFI